MKDCLWLPLPSSLSFFLLTVGGSNNEFIPVKSAINFAVPVMGKVLVKCDWLTMHFFSHDFCYTGEEDGRLVGYSSADPSRRRNSGQLATAGSSLRQKSPITNDASSKDAMVTRY